MKSTIHEIQRKLKRLSKNLIYSSAILVSIFAFTSCSKEDSPVTPPPVNEEEVITTVTTVLKSGAQTITLKSKDLDGDGPNAPVVTVSGNLTANTTYTGTVEFLNEISNPVGNITAEVLTEGVDHQLFFQVPTTFGTFSYNDTDANGKPIGLKFTFVTTTPITGNLTVTLRHKPNKSASGVSGGSITNAGGDTDAEVIFPIQIQ
jgi:hypothetical protein